MEKCGSSTFRLHDGFKQLRRRGGGILTSTNMSGAAINLQLYRCYIRFPQCVKNISVRGRLTPFVPAQSCEFLLKEMDTDTKHLKDDVLQNISSSSHLCLHLSPENSILLKE